MNGLIPERAERQRDWQMLVAILLFTAVVSWPLLPRHASYAVDANTYLAGAISLAKGEGYRAITQVDTPGITFYPPLYSAYLSLPMRWGPAFPDCIPGLNAAMLLLSLVAVAFLFLILREHRLPRSIALVACLTFSLSPTWMLLVSMVFSDVLFTLFGFLLAWLWFRREAAPARNAILITGAVLALSFLTRSAALAWLGGAGLVLWQICGLRQPKVWLATLLPALVALVWWRSRASQGFSYADDFQSRFQAGSYLQHCGENLWGIAGGGWLLDTLSPALVRAPGVMEKTAGGLGPPFQWLAVLAGLALVLLAGAGCWQSREGRTRFWLSFLAVYVAELVLWPFPLGNRVVFVLLPMLLVWAWQGYASLGKRYWPRRCTQLALAVMLLNLAVNAAVLVRQQRGFEQTEAWQELRETADWLNAQVPPDALVAVTSRVPVTLLWSWTGRKFIGGDAALTTARIQRTQPQYFVNAGGELSEILPPGWTLAEVFRSRAGSYVVFRLAPGADGN